jgi:Uri superfamily endonuclease
MVRVGALPETFFPSGYYAYVGSAMGGFEARIGRYLRAERKRHWHIDYPLEWATVTGVILCESGDRLECAIAEALRRELESIPGFGSSDCGCPGHLFYARDEARLRDAVMALPVGSGKGPVLAKGPS